MSSPGVTQLLRKAQAEEAAAQAGDFDDVLRRIALTVNSSLEIRQVLAQVANLSLEAIPADRASIFLLDQSGMRLAPGTAIGSRADPDLWERFRSLDPVDLTEVPARWAAFTGGRAVGIPDTAASPLVPPEIVEVFGTRSALLAPLTAAGEPQGLLCLDWTSSGRDFSEADLARIEAIAGFAALAVRNARLYEGLNAKARLLGRLFEIAGVLNSSRSLRMVLDFICQSYEELLGTSHCSVNLVNQTQTGISTLAVRGVAWFVKSPRMVEAIPKGEIERVRRKWSHSNESVVYRSLQNQETLDQSLIPASVGSAALFPLAHSNRLVGFVVAGFPEPGGPSSETLETGQALAEQAATAVVRTQLDESLQRRLHQMEVLYRLSDVVAGTSDLGSALKQLNKMLEVEAGVKIESIVLTDPEQRREVSAQSPGAEETKAVHAWQIALQRGKPPEVTPSSRGLLVPISHRRRILGTVVLNTADAQPLDDELLLAIGSACAEVVHKAGLRRELAESERRLLIAAERERIAHDLHDSVGQALIGIGMSVSALLPEISDPTLRQRTSKVVEIAARGNQQIRDAIHQLLFVEVRREGLVKSLRELARRLKTSSGIDVGVRIVGSRGPLSAETEDAIFRVAHEALMNVERHSEASVATVSLEYQDKEVSLVICDDGIGISSRSPLSDDSLHFGLRGIKDLAGRVGGEVDVGNCSPRGVKVAANFPLTAGRAGTN
jgi:signal transduction histidine kinase